MCMRTMKWVTEINARTQRRQDARMRNPGFLGLSFQLSTFCLSSSPAAKNPPPPTNPPPTINQQPKRKGSQAKRWGQKDEPLMSRKQEAEIFLPPFFCL